MAYVEFPRRRSQAAKAADCKSAIPGSNPGGASHRTRSHQAAPGCLTRVIPWTWDHPRFLLRIVAARTPSQAKAGFRVLRAASGAARVPFRVPFSKPLPCPAVRVHR